MSVPGQKSERPAEAGKKKTDVTATSVPHPEAKTQDPVLENLRLAEKNNINELNEAFEKRKSAGLGEKALSAIDRMQSEHRAAIENSYKKYREEYQRQSAGRTTERAQLAEKLYEEAKKTGDSRVAYLQALFHRIEKGGKDKHLHEEGIVQLKRLFLGVEKIIQENPEIAKIYELLMNGKELNGKDYQKIIAIFNPNKIIEEKDFKDPKKAFEATSPGLLITLMGPDQRMRFMEELMKPDSPKRGQTGEILDSLLRSGRLTPLQGEELLKKAEAAKLIDPKSSNVRENLESGFYVREAEKVAKAVNEEIARLSQQYAENPMNRLVGAPMLGFGMVIHSAIWLLFNVLKNGKRFFKSPYAYMAILSGAAGLELTGARGIGHGPVSRLIEKLGTDGPKTDAERKVFENFGEFYSTTLFRPFFDGGGAEKIIELRNKKIQANEGFSITPDELSAMMTSKKDRPLKDLMKEARKRPSFDIDILKMAEFCAILHIENKQQYNTKIDLIRANQGVS